MSLLREVPTPTSSLRRGGLGVLALLLALFALWWFLPLPQLVQSAVRWIQALGILGIAVYCVLYVLAILLLAPGTPLTLAGGFVWGPVVGTLVLWPTATLAATTAFTLGRTLARPRVEARFRNNPLFLALDQAAEREGAKVVALLRLSPVSPFNLLNYAFGLTRLSTRSYAIATAAGILPVTVLYTYLGSCARSVTELGAGTAAARDSLYWLGLGMTVLVTLAITRIARRALRQSLEEIPDTPDTPNTGRA